MSTTQVTVRFEQNELDSISAIAVSEGINRATAIRQLVRVGLTATSIENHFKKEAEESRRRDEISKKQLQAVLTGLSLLKSIAGKQGVDFDKARTEAMETVEIVFSQIGKE